MGTLFCQLVEMLKFYIRYDVDDVTGQPLSRKEVCFRHSLLVPSKFRLLYLINENDHFEVAERHHKHVMKLQRTAFRYFKETMSDFALLNVGNVDTRGALLKQFSKMRFILSSISLIFVSAKKSFIGLQNVLI